MAPFRLKCQKSCCKPSDPFYRICHRTANHTARAFPTSQQQPSEASAGTRSSLLMLTPSQSLPSVWGLSSPLGRVLGASPKPLVQYRKQKLLLWKAESFTSLGTGIGGSKESWQIYGECRTFLQGCIPGKPSSTWFDSNNNSFTEPPSVNRVGWTTFSSCFCFKTPSASSAMTAVWKLNVFSCGFFSMLFFYKSKSQHDKFAEPCFCLFYLCNQCQWKH